MVLIAVLVCVFYFAQRLEENAQAVAFIEQFGYTGVLIIAIITGLSAFLPVPAATFVPIFTAAGLLLPLITLMLIIGTTIADVIGYLIGRVSKGIVEDEYPETYKRFLKIKSEHHRLLLPFIFLYAAFVPLPNEAFLIPVALMGVPLRTFIIPLVLGTIVNQTALAYGAQGIFSALFGL